MTGGWLIAGVIIVALLAYFAYQDAKLAPHAALSLEDELDMLLGGVL